MSTTNYQQLCIEAYDQAKIEYNIESLEQLILQFDTSKNKGLIGKLQNKYKIMLENMVLTPIITIDKHSISIYAFKEMVI